jgi:hypothetical protein
LGIGGLGGIGGVGDDSGEEGNKTSFNSGRIVTICFFILWCGIAFAMGIFAYQAGAPIIFPIFASAMGVFGILFCLRVNKQMGQKKPLRKRPVYGYGDEYVTVTGDSRDSNLRPHGREKSVYQAPSLCTSCGASLSTDDVDWVGPLQLQCPYCNATIDAKERIL